jgi:hypothetical protein
MLLIRNTAEDKPIIQMHLFKNLCQGISQSEAGGSVYKLYQSHQTFECVNELK